MHVHGYNFSCFFFFKGVLLTEMISNMKAKTKQALDRDIILYSAVSLLNTAVKEGNFAGVNFHKSSPAFVPLFAKVSVKPFEI